MKFTLLYILLTTYCFLTVGSLPVSNMEENGIPIPTEASKGLDRIADGNDLAPAEYFYPGLGFGLGFHYPGYVFYSRPYWHHFHGYRPYFAGYHTGHGVPGPHWHHRY